MGRSASGCWGTCTRSTAEFALDRPPEPEIYLPYSAEFLTSKTFVVRTDGHPYSLVAPVRRAILETDPEQPLRSAGGREAISMRDLVNASLARVRFQTFVLMLLAGLAIGVSALGLFAVLSQLVTERRREIGIRMAIGADRHSVLLWIIVRTVRLAAAAAALSIAAALLAGRVIEALLYDVSARDPLTFGAALGAFLCVAFAASASPALRATRLDPARVLRE